jgi:hypothetical protein
MNIQELNNKYLTPENIADFRLAKSPTNWVVGLVDRQEIDADRNIVYELIHSFQKAAQVTWNRNRKEWVLSSTIEEDVNEDRSNPSEFIEPVVFHLEVAAEIAWQIVEPDGIISHSTARGFVSQLAKEFLQFGETSRDLDLLEKEISQWLIERGLKTSAKVRKESAHVDCTCGHWLGFESSSCSCSAKTEAFQEIK